MFSSFTWFGSDDVVAGSRLRRDSQFDALPTTSERLAIVYYAQVDLHRKHKTHSLFSLVSAEEIRFYVECAYYIISTDSTHTHTRASVAKRTAEPRKFLSIAKQWFTRRFVRRTIDERWQTISACAMTKRQFFTPSLLRWTTDFYSDTRNKLRLEISCERSSFP